MVTIIFSYFYYIIFFDMIQVEVIDMEYITKQMIKNMLDSGIEKGYSHLLIICDKWDYEYYPKYVLEKDDINDVIKRYGGDNLEVIMEIYNYGLDLESQLNEYRSYHPEVIGKPINQDDERITDKALEFARNKHKGQYRKGKKHEEYITHPIEVAQLVRKYKKSHQINTLIAAAYLHDVLEDTNTTFNELVENFGIGVASLVMEVTTTKEIKEEIGKAKYLAIKMRYMSDYALTIKLCDTLSNISSLFDVDDKFRENYVNEKLFILDDLLENRKLTETQLTIVKNINGILNIIIQNNLKDIKENIFSKNIKEKIKEYNETNKRS